MKVIFMNEKLSQLNQNLKNLIGIEITRTFRAVDMQCFAFGTLIVENKDEKMINVGIFRLHIQGHWRIITKEEIVIGSDEMY
jgi:hypothetical protein